MQEALTPELESRCENPQCGAPVVQRWSGRAIRFCSKDCARRKRHLDQVERCKDLTHKTCRKCQEDQPIGNFRHPWMPECRACMKKLRQRQYERQGGKEYMYEQHLANTYGLTLAEYRARFEAQKGLCAICGEAPRRGGRLCVDHNHTTGAVRDLLCAGCNTALGIARDKPDRLLAMIAYLERHAPKTSDAQDGSLSPS